LGERAFHRWRGREKDTIAAAKATLTLVPVSVGKPEAGGIVRLKWIPVLGQWVKLCAHEERGETVTLFA
jgi:hypothetical protein